MPIDRDTLALAAGLVGVLGLGLGVLAYPKYLESKAIKRDIVRLRAEATKPSEGPEVIDALTTELESLRRRGERRMTPIPQDKGIAELLRDLSAKLDEMSLSKREMTTGTESQLEEASVVPVSIMIEGPFPQIYEVASYLEQLPRLVRLQRLRIASSSGTRSTIDRSGNVRAELMLDVFYHPRALASSGTDAVTDLIPEAAR